MNEDEIKPPETQQPELLHGRLQMETHQAGGQPECVSRRNFFAKLCIGLSGLCAVILGVPLVGFIVSPLFRKSPQKWITVGKTRDFQVGQTVNVTFMDPSPLAWAGITAKNAAWLRRAARGSRGCFRSRGKSQATHYGMTAARS